MNFLRQGHRRGWDGRRRRCQWARHESLFLGVDLPLALLEPIEQGEGAATGNHLEVLFGCGALNHGSHRTAPAAQTHGRHPASAGGCLLGFCQGLAQPKRIHITRGTHLGEAKWLCITACGRGGGDQQFPTLAAIGLKNWSGVKVEFPVFSGCQGSSAHPADCSCCFSMFWARLARSAASAITLSFSISSSPGGPSRRAVLRPMRPRPGSSSVIRADTRSP